MVQEMQRVFILFVGILSVVRATPFDLDSVNRPTPSRYNVELGNDAFSKYFEHDDYEIGKLESVKTSNFIDVPVVGRSTQGLIELFGDLKDCEIMDLQKPPKGGCAYASHGDVYFIRALSGVDIKDVFKALEDAGIKECDLNVLNGFKDVPEGGCFWINDFIETLHLIGIYDDDGIDETIAIYGIKDIMDNIEECNVTDAKIPEEGCVLIEENAVHLINVLTVKNIVGVKRALIQLDQKGCYFNEDHILLTRDPCYELDDEINSIHFLNVHGPEGIEDDDDYYYDSSEEYYEIPDTEVSPLSFSKL